jgi:hypothetical protein
MLETPHALVGAAIAVKVVNPLLAIPLSFASHFLLDKTPHWNPHLGTEKGKFGKVKTSSTAIIIIDSSLALLSGSFLAFRALPNTTLALTILFSCFAACLPDIIEIPYYYCNSKGGLMEKWVTFQKSIQENAGPFWGTITQLITIAAAIWWMSV